MVAAGEKVAAGDGHRFNRLRQVRPEVQEEFPLLGVAANVAAAGHKNLVFDSSWLKTEML